MKKNYDALMDQDECSSWASTESYLLSKNKNKQEINWGNN